MQEELLAVARFWLERGVDGFRLDTINFYFCDSELRDNPVLPPELRDYSTAPAVNPYNWQEHLYDKSRPEMIGFLRRLRAVMSEFGDIAAVGEVGDAQRGMEIMGEYTRGDDLMQMCYAFEFLSPDAPSGRRVGQVLRRFAQVASDGWACWAFSNHDVERHATRWHMDAAQLRVYFALHAQLRGSVCLYQGEELGLTEAYVPVRGAAGPLRQAVLAEVPRPGRLPDADALAGRQPVCRLLRGEALAAGGAWSTCRMAVSVQDGDPESMLAFYRRMLAWRKTRPALAKGELRAAGDLGQPDLLRAGPRRASRSSAPSTSGRIRWRRRCPTGEWRVIDGTGFAGAIVGRQVELPPLSGALRGAGRKIAVEFVMRKLINCGGCRREPDVARACARPCAAAEGRIKSESAAVEAAAGRGSGRCFWSAARRCSTSSSRARPGRRRRPTRRAPAARRSTWRSGWRGWGRRRGC